MSKTGCRHVVGQYPEAIRRAVQENRLDDLVILLTSQKGRDLLAQKQNIDIHAKCSDDNCFNLEYIVFHLLSESQRQSVLQYFQHHAYAQNRLWHVLSDVDDTLLPRLEKHLRSSDLYPGVRQLITEFSKEVPYVTLLTARPVRYHQTTRREFGPHCLHLNVLHGDTANLLTVALNRLMAPLRETWKDYEVFARRKIEQAIHYALLYPEYQFIFLGDAAQGDVLASISMRSIPLLSQRVRACIIRDILGPESLFDRRWKASMELPNRDALKSMNIFVCNDYLQAATALHDTALLTERQLARIKNAFIADSGT